MDGGAPQDRRAPRSTAHPPRTRRAATAGQRVGEVLRGTGFRRIFAARLISQFGDGMFQLGSASVLIFENPSANPAMDSLIATAVVLIPFSAIGPFTGVFIDRWERRTILTWVPIARAVVAASAPLAALTGTKGPVFLIVVLFVLSANRFFLATMSAVLPQLVPEDDLIAANAVATTGGSIANVVGLASGAGLAAVLGGTVSSGFAALAFGASALTARLVPVHRGFAPGRAPLSDELARVLHDMRAGLRMLRGSYRAVYGLSSIAAVQLLVGTMVGGLTYLFVADLDLGIGSATRLLAVLAVGLFVGVVIVPVMAERIPHDRLIPISFLISATATLLASIDPTRIRSEAAAVFIGIAYAFAKIPVDTIVQEEMPDAFRGRAFAVYDMLFNVARVGGVAIAALAFRWGASSRGVMLAIALGAYAAGGGFAVLERRLSMFGRRKGPGRGPSPEDLLLPGELVTVRSYAGSRADEEPRVIVVGGHELPVERIHWRALVDENGRRTRAFVVGIGGRRVRLAHHDDGTWEIERILPAVEEPSGA